MPVKYTDNVPKLKDDIRTRTALFLRFFLDEVQKNADPMTPYDQGFLRRSPLKSVVGMQGTIQWVKEYAAAQEVGTTRGFAITNYTTPGTGAHYAEKAVQKAKETAPAVMARAGLVR